MDAIDLEDTIRISDRVCSISAILYDVLSNAVDGETYINAKSLLGAVDVLVELSSDLNKLIKNMENNTKDK